MAEDIDPLNPKIDSAFGRSNGYDWLIYPGPNADKVINKLTSLHEYAHNELDSITSLGFLFLSLATIARNEDVEISQYCKRLFISLRQQSKFVHEVYATWFSTTRFKEDFNDLSVDILLKNNTEYRIYYQVGDSLVNEIPSLYLRTLCMVALSRICFESSALCNAFISNFADFNVSDIRSAEFPDQRFNLLISNYNSNAFIKLIQLYSDKHPGTPAHAFLTSELNGTTVDMGDLEEDFINFNEDLLDHIHKDLKLFFEKRGFKSLSNREATEFRKFLLQFVNSTCPNDSIIIHPDPYNVERNMIIFFEGETVLFNKQESIGELIFSENLKSNNIEDIRQHFEQEKCISLFARRAHGLSDQYIFINEDHMNWLNSLNDTIFYIPFTTIENNTAVVKLVVLQNLEILSDIVGNNPNNLPIYGCTFVSAFANEQWWETYEFFFTEQCTSFYVYNDISILFYLESYIQNMRDIKYCNVNISIDEKSFTLLLTEFLSEEGYVVKLISLVGDAFCDVLYAYINKSFTNILYDAKLETQYKPEVEKIISMISKDFSHYYNTKSISYFS